MKIDEFGALFTEMLREYNEDRSGSQEILKHYLSILCIKLFRRYTTINEQKKKDEKTDYAKIVIDYLEKNSFESFKLEEIAKKTFLLPPLFSDGIQKEYGKESD